MSSMKIMLVDDDVFVRDMYATKFTEHGDTVVTAKDGNEAMQKLAKADCDVVLMDMVMPGITGVDLIKAIKGSEGSVNKVKCIVLSNQSEETDIKAANDAGAVGYIIKAELIPSEVVVKVHELINI